MVKPLQRRSLAGELTLSLVALVAIIVIGFSFFLYARLSEGLLREVERKADEYATHLVDILSIPMWNFDSRTLEQVGAVFAQYDLVNGIEILDMRGEPLFRLRKVHDPYATLVRSDIIRFEGEPIGRINMVFTLKSYHSTLQKTAIYGIIIIFIVILVLLIATGILLRIFLRRPLSTLQAGMERIAQGDFSYDMRSVPQTELLDIAEKFAIMAEKVEARERDLHEMNMQLQDEIATRRATEKALRTSEERYSLAVHGTNDGLWDWDLRTNSVYFAPRWKAIIGYENDEIRNEIPEWENRVHPDDLDYVRRAHEEYMQRSTPEFKIEYRLRHKDGSWRWILGRGACLWDETGTPYRMAGAHTDITEWKASEQALLEAKNTVDNIINAMPSAIVGVDQNGFINLWNLTAANQTGLPLEQALHKPLDTVMPEFAFLLAEVRRSIDEGHSIVLQKVSLMTAGAPRNFDIVIFPVVTRGAFGGVIRMDDVTARIRIEEMMVQTEKMLSVGGLAAGMAHEINNPLGGILQGAQNILRRLDPALTPNQRIAAETGCNLENMQLYMERRGILNFIEGIRDSGLRAASIVSNMLEFSRRSETRWSKEDIPVLVERTIELAANDYDLKKRYDFRHIDIVRQFAPGLPAILCMPTEIEQVLLNLLKNAAQAMSKRGDRVEPPRITISARQDGESVIIDIADNGPGMDEDVRRRVFEPFFTTKKVGEGTGLGLSVSYFIITNNHSGAFTVDSEPGVGTCFSIRLPIQQAGQN